MKSTSLSRSLDEDMVVELPRELYRKIMFWVDISPIEISGLGKCIFEDGKWKVLSVHLLDQENTATSTDLDSEAVGKLDMALIREKGHLNFWWHSHVDMKAFWSGTDLDTIKEYGDAGFCLATVFNKRGDTQTAFYQGATDFLPSMFKDHLTLEIVDDAFSDAELLELKTAYEEKCRTKKWAAPANNWRGKQVGTALTGTTKKNSGATISTDKLICITEDIGARIKSPSYIWDQKFNEYNVFVIFQDGTYMDLGSEVFITDARELYRDFKDERKEMRALGLLPMAKDVTV